MTFHVLKVDPSRTQFNVSLEIFISRVFLVLLLFIDVNLFSENRIHFEYITMNSYQAENITNNVLSPNTGINKKKCRPLYLHKLGNCQHSIITCIVYCLSVHSSHKAKKKLSKNQSTCNSKYFHASHRSITSQLQLFHTCHVNNPTNIPLS